MIRVDPSNLDRGALATALQFELGRRRLADFALLTIPGFEDPPHIRHLASLLESIENGTLKRLIVNVPPGHGKSTLVAQAFPAWYLGRNPRRKIITASSGAELAERNSRAARSLLVDDRWPFEATLSPDTRSMTRWNTVDGGGLYAIGVDGLVTGWRGDLLVCDDLQNSAGGEGERDGVWSWFREVLTPRLEPDGAIVMICTRWGEDDISGRILDSPDGAQWTVVRLPAFAEAEDPLGRAPHEALWPERWPIAALMDAQLAVGSRAFACQFQSDPVPAAGNVIKGEWLQRFDLPQRLHTGQPFEKVVCALDAAAKTGVRNDYSAIVTIGVTKNAYYVLDVWAARVEFPSLLRRVKQLEEDAPKPSAIYVEDTSNATALIQQLKQESRIPIVPVSAKGSKESRVEAITGLFEAKKVFLPVEASWLLEFERELLAFPAGKHDDQVDALTLALSKLRESPSILSWGKLSTRSAMRSPYTF